MEDKIIYLSSSTTHLGLLRSEVNENMINIDERLSLARRTLYALINIGVHGSNGLNPRVSYRIYQCYVVPRLLYGLEVLSLTATQINIPVLSKFHLDSLKKFQSLPVRVATSAVYLLLGALPLEAELHKRQLCLLFNILTSSNETLKELTKRQIAVNLENKLSYYSRVQDILELYKLPPLKELKNCLTTKENWKFQVRTAVVNHWTSLLQIEAREKSTLCFMNINSTKIGQTHSAWSSLESTVADVRKGIVKARLLTGTYLVQINKYKFSKSSESATCKCCGLYDEDITHMLLDCPALHNQRKLFYPKVKELVISYIGLSQSRTLFHTKQNIIKLLIDCSIFPEFTSETAVREVAKATTELCYRLHIQRIYKLKQINGN